MTTIADEVAEGTFEFFRGGDGKIAVEWHEKIDGSYEPKDLSGWSATLQMESLGEVFYQAECVCCPKGVIVAKIPASVIQSGEWGSRLDGTWRIIGYGPEERQEVIGMGYYTIR